YSFQKNVFLTNVMEKKKLNILLIEDNKADVRLIKELLKTNKDFIFELESNPRLSESVNLIKTKKFDIILLDLTLPDSDRESTLENVLNVTTEIPIIILTGLDDKDFALKSLQNGAQDYIVKDDLNSSILIRAILYAIERHKVEIEKAREKAPKIPFDEKDKEILNYLQDNYRISYKDLSKKVNLAASTIHNRVQNMIKEGIIKKFDTFVDPFKVGYESIAIVGLSVDPLKLDAIARKLSNFDEIQLIASSTGDHNLILQIIAKDEKMLWKFINEDIKTIDGIQIPIHVSSFIDLFKMTNKINFNMEKKSK
ncbi:MAG: winged helix-turn-helix transcriptional regulator, partial [Promethearchaeota archaeon]